MKIKIIASSPIDIQDEITELINQEFETIATWKDRNSHLDQGEVQIKIDNDIYIINATEYVEIV